MHGEININVDRVQSSNQSIPMNVVSEAVGSPVGAGQSRVSGTD